MASYKDKGIAFIKAAVEEDQTGNFDAAFDHYTDGIQCLVEHIKVEQNQAVKDKIVIKLKEYLERAELLKSLAERQGGNKLASTSSLVMERPPQKPIAPTPAVLSPRPSRRASISKNDLREMGIGYVTEAVQADAAGNHEDAFEYYKSACDFLGQYLKQEDSPRVRRVITSKLKEYLDRAEYLKAVVEQQRQQASMIEHQSAPRSNSHNYMQQKSLLDLVMVQVRHTVRFRDLVNQQPVKDSLQQLVVKPLTSGDTGNDAPKNVLLYGPAGVGKTELLKSVASESGCRFFSVSSWFLTSKSLGADCESLISQIFATVVNASPSILFFDDVDAFSSDQSRSGVSDRVTQLVIARLNELRACKACVSVLAATSEPYFLDTGMLNCFDKQIFVPLPDASARREYLLRCLGTTPHDVSETELGDLVSRTEGYTFADCKVLANDAIMQPVRRTKEASYFRKVPLSETSSLLSETSSPTLLETTSHCYMPCTAGDDGSFETTVMELVGDGHKDLIRPPPVTMEDFQVVLRYQRPSVSAANMEIFRKFQKEVACQGSGCDPVAAPGTGAGSERDAEPTTPDSPDEPSP